MAISFENVTNAVGISKVGLTYGTAWGDFDGDGLPDIWINNHFEDDSILYLNQVNSFTDITSTAFNDTSELLDDNHGSAWVDFDNDGDQDLTQLVAGPNPPNRFFVNDGGTLTDRAAQLGISYDVSRSQSAVWFDYDNDGLLDLLHLSEVRSDGLTPSTVFRQTENGFEDVGATVAPGIRQESNNFAILSDLSGDGNLDVIFPSLEAVYDTTSTPFTDITDTLVSDESLLTARDAVAADFNGDLLPDLYLTRSTGNIGIDQNNPNSVRSQFVPRRNEQGFEFSTSGDLSLNVSTTNVAAPNEIFIGSSGFNPSSNIFTLSPDDPNVQGIFPHTPGVDEGVYIGYDPQEQTWQLLASTPNNAFRIASVIESTEPITDVVSFGFSNPTPPQDRLLINTGNGLVDSSEQAGISDLNISGRSVVSGDFDNDMDVDIYVLDANGAINRPNVLLENQGDGTFVSVPDAGGAAGTNLGLGESVSVADYDGDGFLDFFTTNGLTPQKPLPDDGPHELFRNLGNGNHWLEIDLEGVLSNRDGIGSSVYATAGGVTQLREQNGGFHRWSQSHQRLHFGLANNTNVRTLEVRWTSGVNQQLRSISADQIITVVEGVGFDGNDAIDGSDGNDTLIGNGGSDRLRGLNGDDSIDGGLGNDRLFGNSGNDLIFGREGNDNIVGGSGQDRLFGDEGNDRLVANGGNDTVDGGDGDDRLFGNGGIDVLHGREGNDTLNGGGGQDILFGDEGADLLIGQGGHDTLDGGSGNDTLTGGNGNDILIGGNGNNTMRGDGGRDRFRFLAPPNGVDNVVDFSVDDNIEITASGFGGGLSEGTLAADQFVLGNAAQDSNDRFIYNQNTGNLFYDSDGANGNNSVLVAILSNQAELTADDILII